MGGAVPPRGTRRKFSPAASSGPFNRWLSVHFGWDYAGTARAVGIGERRARKTSRSSGGAGRRANPFRYTQPSRQSRRWSLLEYSRTNPSPRYRELLALYRQMHVEGERTVGLPPEKTFSGVSLGPQINRIKRLANK